MDVETVVCAEKVIAYRATRHVVKSDVNIVSGYDLAIEVAEKFLKNKPYEEFWVLALNSEMKFLGATKAGVGTTNKTNVHLRNVFSFLFYTNATAYIIAHNHPSGGTAPSREDIELTDKLVEISPDLGVTLLDHIIVGEDVSLSMKEAGHLF